MNQDILSDLLRHIRLRGAVYYDVQGSSTWAAEAPPSSAIASAIMPGSEHMIEYHMVLAGQCWGGLIDTPPVRLGPGDLILFPHGDPHVLSSAPGMRALADVAGMLATRAQVRPFALNVGAPEQANPAERVRLICGFFGCELRPFNPLIAALPRMLHLPASAETAWMAGFLQQAAAESGARRQGSDAMLERVSEMIFIGAIRRHAEDLPEHSQGWLAGVRDRMVGRALALIHADPAHPWTVEELGRRIGLSRSALHERFGALLDTTPMQYLANWRMQVATSRLRSTNAAILDIALSVGYESESAHPARAGTRA